MSLMGDGAPILEVLHNEIGHSHREFAKLKMCVVFQYEEHVPEIRVLITDTMLATKGPWNLGKLHHPVGLPLKMSRLFVPEGTPVKMLGVASCLILSHSRSGRTPSRAAR
jgi:hypothetical protein